MRKFPIDVESLKKGDMISTAKIARWAGAKTQDEIDFAKMHAMKQVEKELRDAGRLLTIRTLKDGLAILTDADASKHNCRSARSALNKHNRRCKLMAAVDRDELDPDQRKDHDRNLMNMRRVQQAIHRSRREIEPIEHERRTPRMVG